MSRIEIIDVKKKYGSLEILKGVSIDIQDGEFVTLIGPSGCGKSTLLKVIAGLEETTSGEIRIGGQDVSGLPPQKRDLAMVFQNYALYPQMTVRENMSFGLRVKGFKKETITKKVNDIANTLELSQLLDRRPRELSGGQRQRVAMGRAMVREPKAFLLDEPLSNLDAALRTSMRSEIKQLHQKLRRTMVYVTHDQIEAMTMADRIAIMNRGNIVQYGTPDDLYSRPCNEFVASFFGMPQINIWPAEIVGEEDGRLLAKVAEGAVFSIPKFDGLKHRNVHLGVRPEAMSISASGINATVRLVEPTGAQTQVTTNITNRMSAEAHILIPGKFNCANGSSVFLNHMVDDVHLFDAASGTRLN